MVQYTARRAGWESRRSFSLAQDLTERLNLEKHIQQSQRLNAVGQLAAGVAHDFNNILTIITGHAGILLGQSNIPADARPDLEHIENAALRASSLTRQLLAFSRQQAMFPRPIHLYEVVKNTVTMLARAIGGDVTFKVRFGESLLPIEADPAMIEQVITNLVLNARDAMPRGGTLTVAIERVEIFDDAAQRTPDARSGTAVCLSVTDTGMGIAAEHLPHLFEPFFTQKKVAKEPVSVSPSSTVSSSSITVGSKSRVSLEKAPHSAYFSLPRTNSLSLIYRAVRL